MDNTQKAFEIARERYLQLGVDAEVAIDELKKLQLSIHCWQGDDVNGFEVADQAGSGGGIAVTGNYPGRARNIDELQADLLFALSQIPGSHRVNLHAMYGDFGARPVDRDEISVDHFSGWVDWARENSLGLDFNATCFGHRLADSGFTLSSLDEKVREFWIEHVRRCRHIAAWMGNQLGSASVHNLWIPDGAKDLTVSRAAHRRRLAQSLDEIYATDYSAVDLKDSVESKLFGIGSESFVVGSYDFYLAWCRGRGVMPCLDLGHYHPTESVADKISALLIFFDELLLHVSRGIRWDSDHVVILSDELVALMQEVKRAGGLGRVNLALDYFDASINRIGAWVIGARATQKALLYALLEPTETLAEMEAAGDYHGRLALLEELKTLPFGEVWDHFCELGGVGIGQGWIDKVRQYEKEHFAARD